MRRAAVIMFVFVFVMAAVWAMAEDKMSKDEACALLGDCGEDMVKTAKAMQVACDKMIVESKKLMEKGKLIRGQGMIWQDKEMEGQGQALYDQGKKMYDQAKAMSDTCALVIAAGEQTQKKYKKASGKKDGKEPSPKGDHVPY